MISTIKTFDCCAGRLTVKLPDDPRELISYMRLDFLPIAVHKSSRAYLKNWAAVVREDPDMHSLALEASEWAFVAEQLIAEGVL